MLSVRKLKVVVPAMLAVFAGALLCASAPVLAAAPETPALTVESHYPSPVSPSTEAVLHGVLNPGGVGPQFTFELGTYEFLYNEGPDCEGGAATPRGISFGEGPEMLPAETIGGLSEGKEHTVCLRFVTAGGEAVKPEVHFTTSVRPEAPVTHEAESITATSATFNGELNPLNAGTVGYEFMYNQGSSCEFGTTTTPGAEQTGKAVEVSTSVTGLAANTEYTFCAVAVNASGEPVLGAPSTFKTLPAAPEVIALGEQSSSVTPFEARLEATVNPENEPTSCVFEYGTSTAYTTKVPCEQGTLGGGEQPVSATILGLAPATVYHFRVVVQNATGKMEGLDAELTTSALQPPVVDSESASAATSNGVTLEAQINPEYQATKYSFEYSTTESGGELQLPITKLAGKEALPAVFGDQTASVSTGPVLASGTTYYYRVIAENGQSETEGKPATGPVQSFATVPAPSTDAVTGVTATTAMFHGTLTPLNATFVTEYLFDYNIGNTCIGAGNTTPEAAVAEAVSTEATGLEPNATYTVCLAATNIFGSVIDTKVPPVSFQTHPAAPSIESQGASVQSPFAATLEATVNPNNEKTTCAFEYATIEAAIGTPSATTVACPPLGEGGSGVGTSVALTGLQQHTKYYFRVSATNTTGTTTYPTIGEFETPTAIAPTIESESAALVTSTGALLQAQINPNYQETTYTFEYATKESTLRKGQGTKVTGGTLPAGNSGQAVHVSLHEVLTPGTKYYYRAVATNTAGTTNGMPVVNTFTTPTPPTASTGTAEFVTSGAATVSGTVNPEGQETHYTIEYGPTTGYGQNTTSTLAGTEATPVQTGPIKLNTLLPGTTYHYRLVAINALGETTNGADMQFTTAAAPPAPSAPSNGSGEAPPQSTSSTSTAGVFPNLTAIAPVPATKEAGETAPSEAKTLTRAQKLSKALKACKRSKGAKRSKCERQARSKYGPKAKGKRGKK